MPPAPPAAAAAVAVVAPIRAIGTDELAVALDQRCGDVDSALYAVSPVGRRIGLAELAPLFGVSRDDHAKFAARIVGYLVTFSLIDEFTAILRGQGSQVSAEAMVNMRMAPGAGERFFRRTIFSRCAIYRGDEFKGSGCLVGPSLVLTCAHVLEAANQNDEFDDVQILLATRVWARAFPKPAHLELPAASDTADALSEHDDDYLDHNDFALLKLRLPAGSNASTVSIPGKYAPTRDAVVAILDYPRGEDKGVGWAFIGAFDKPSARWCYTAPTQDGSSGAACFNASGEFIGIHQGKIANGKRFVPYDRFRSTIDKAISLDLGPSYLWSLDGRLAGTLVIGRRDLFVAFAKMAEPGCGFRTMRIYRLDPALGYAGLGFSVRLVQELVRRRPDGHRALTLAWPQALYADFDIIDELAKVAHADGLIAHAVSDEHDGVATGETGFATAAKARADLLVRELHAAAERNGETIWIVVEHATVDLGRQTIALETLAALVQRWPRLRIVLVGNETVRLPDSEFPVTALDVANAPTTGTLVEFVTGFERKDVEDFIDRFHEDRLDGPPTAMQRKGWTNAVLDDLIASGTRYKLGDLSTAIDRLRAIFRPLAPEP